MSAISKKAFGFLEIVVVVFIIGLISWFFLPKMNLTQNRLDIVTNRLVLYLKQTRYQAMLENQYNNSDPKWHKKRWSFKIMRCTNEADGFYYTIYSDTNKTGQVAKAETLKDPLSNKYIYNNNQCQVKEDRSPYVLLSKEYGITNITISCNDTSTIGQLSFGYDGKLYSKLSNKEYEHYDYLVTQPCHIKLSNSDDFRTIVIEPITGFVQKK